MSDERYRRSITVERREAIDDFISRLSLMKHEACKLGLYQTHQAMEIPVTKVGYELAELLTSGETPE